MKDKYRIAVEALHRIARREHCNCGCPNARKAAPLRPIESFFIAWQALQELGEPNYVMAVDLTDPKPVTKKFIPQYPLD